MKDDEQLELRVKNALEDPAYAGHPLRGVLLDLYARFDEQSRQIDRIVEIADRYQWAERDRGLDYATRFERQLRQVDKIARISDHYQHMLLDMNERLQLISNRDDLTGLPNRRFMLGRLREELERLPENPAGFSVVLADVDHFKRINDSYGHDAGDRVLAAIGQRLAAHIRGSDSCARWGGEEFLLLFPGAGNESVRGVLERLRERIADVTDLLPEGALPLTLSFGVAACLAPGEALEQVLQRADRALYAAKRQGRDRIVAV